MPLNFHCSLYSVVCYFLHYVTRWLYVSKTQARWLSTANSISAYQSFMTCSHTSVAIGFYISLYLFVQHLYPPLTVHQANVTVLSPPSNDQRPLAKYHWQWQNTWQTSKCHYRMSLMASKGGLWIAAFFIFSARQHMLSALYDTARPSVRLSVRPSLRQTGGSAKNG